MQSTRPGFSTIELVVTVGVIGLLTSLAAPAVLKVREYSRGAQCAFHLKQIGLAIHSYHDGHLSLPPSTIGASLSWGWAALILPEMGETALYERLSSTACQQGASGFGAQMFDFPTDNDVLTIVVPTYRCPSDIGSSVASCASPDQINGVSISSSAQHFGRANYACVFGTVAGGGAFASSGGQSHRLADVTDGLSNVFLVGERRSWKTIDLSTGMGGDTLWAGNVGTEFEIGGFCGGGADVARLNRLELAQDGQQRGAAQGFSSLHPGGAYFLLGDGRVRFVNEAIDIATFGALARIADGQIISDF